MKRVVWLCCCSFGLGCSAADPGGAVVGAPTGGGGAAASLAGATMGGGGFAAASGSGGIATTAAGAATSGGVGGGGSATDFGGGGSAGSSGGGVSALSGSGGETAGTAGTVNLGGAGASGASGCVPDPSGTLGTVGDTVHDSKTCLDWMKTTKTGVNYAAADAFCGDATTGGFDDWRVPTASEFASTITLCGKYPPDGPTDTKFFDQQGDGYWTSTPAGEPNKVCAIGMLDAGDYYHYGTAGPQVVRCVRGTGSVPMIKDCTLAQGCKTW